MQSKIAVCVHFGAVLLNQLLSVELGIGTQQTV